MVISTFRQVTATMGLCASVEQNSAKFFSATIDRQITDDSDMPKECKILLLGVLEDLLYAFQRHFNYIIPI